MKKYIYSLEQGALKPAGLKGMVDKKIINMDQNHRTAYYYAFFSDLEKKNNLALPSKVIEAVVKYKLIEHQKSIKEWLANTEDKNSIDVDGNTLLHIAAKATQAGLLSWLIKQGLCVDAENKEGDTPLSVALKQAGNPGQSIGAYQRLYKIITSFLKAGARNVSNKDFTDFMKKNNIILDEVTQTAKMKHN